MRTGAFPNHAVEKEKAPDNAGASILYSRRFLFAASPSKQPEGSQSGSEERKCRGQWHGREIGSLELKVVSVHATDPAAGGTVDARQGHRINGVQERKNNKAAATRAPANMECPNLGELAEQQTKRSGLQVVACNILPRPGMKCLELSGVPRERLQVGAIRFEKRIFSGDVPRFEQGRIRRPRYF